MKTQRPVATLHDHTVRWARQANTAFLWLKSINVFRILHSHSLLIFTRGFASFEEVKYVFEAWATFRLSRPSEVESHWVPSQVEICSWPRLLFADTWVGLIHIALTYFQLESAVFHRLRKGNWLDIEVSIIVSWLLHSLSCAHHVVIWSRHQNPCWDGGLMVVLESLPCLSERLHFLSRLFSEYFLGFTFFRFLALAEISIRDASLLQFKLTMNLGVK